MLAQRNGHPPGCKPVHLKDPPKLQDVDKNAESCCSFSSSPSAGGCPWARLAGVDGCLSEPYCLWFQLLARAYWGEVELGLSCPNRGMSWSRLREASRKNCVRSRSKQKDGRDQSEASAPISPGGEEEPFCWPGPKTLHLRRTSQGFGFTLRHFIVYPPESAVHNSIKDDENGSRGRQRNRLEPMDTIFVKQVKEGGPAHGAGLCTGDRIVKVNGESIIGKTYSQVIALIQNSDSSLELCVMPKDEDILQLFSRDITALAYSQDAYLKGNEAYSGNAQNIPEPPPICYPRIELKAAGMAQSLEPATVSETPEGLVQGPRRRGAASENSYRVEIPVPPSPPPQQTSKTQAVVCVSNENVRTMGISPDPVDRGSWVARAGPSHRTEENWYSSSAECGSNRPGLIISTVPGGVQLQYTSSHLTETPNYSPSTSRPGGINSETLAPPVRASLTAASADTFSTPSTNHYSPSPTAPSTSPHQNIDWRNYTTYKDYIDAKRLHTYGCRTIQERLDSLRAAANSNSAYAQQSTPLSCNSQKAGSQVRRRSASNDRGGDTGSQGTAVITPIRSVSQERLGGATERPIRNWPRSASQDALPFSNTVRVLKPRARSCDYLGQQVRDQDGVVSGDRGAVEDKLLLCDGDKKQAKSQEASQKTLPHLNRSVTGQEEEVQQDGLANSAGATPDFTKGTTDSALPSRTDGLIMRPSRLPVKNSISDLSPALSSIKTTDPFKDQKAIVMGNHLGFSSPLNLQLRGRADSLKMDNRLESGLAARSSSCSGSTSKLPMHRQLQSGVVTISSCSSSSTGAITHKPNVRETSSSTSALERTNGGLLEGVEGPDATVVVLRTNKTSGQAHVRPPSYVLAVNDNQSKVTRKSPPLVKAGSADGAMCWMSNESCREIRFKRLGDTRQTSGSKNLDDSLDSIPFIDEPSSPSIDQDSAHIPASVVISAAPLIATIPPSPTSSSHHISRKLSHDQESGTKTERSRSYDEGINNYQEEGRGRSLLPGLKGLRKAVDRSSDDSESRRDSSSDVFCDATKEGFLHFKQLHTDKSKRVGGGMRQWKQMYAVLRGHYLCLYKDKKEGQAHASCQTVEEPLQISIKACLIDISYSDTKRKNALRLTTSNCEYLFQAEDREDMLAWIRVIQESSNLDEENAAFTSHDLISRRIKEYNTLMSPTGSKTEPSPRASRQSLSIRQTLLGGKESKATSPHSPKPEQEKKNMHKDDTSPPKDKGTWRKGIPGLMRKPFEKKPSPAVTFGVRLDDCPPAHNNKFVPLIVEVCCKLVEERGLEYTGIYRVPGNNAAISNMQEELNNKGMTDIDIQDDKWRDLNVISSLLKSFFRKLPEPLFTNDRYTDFIDANRIEDPVERLKVLKRLLHELPDHHYETLKFLSAHLKTVAENSEKNKMEPRNLAIVFGPTLVRTTDDNMTHMVTHMPDQYKIVETLIQNYDWFFTENGNGDPVTVSQEESTIESQPVPNIDHLLTNIGRTGTSQGDVSDSPASDSAKSKERELLVTSIFAAASRKRKKKEKPQPSSSDDDLDSVFLKMEIPTLKSDHHAPHIELRDEASPSPNAKPNERHQEERKENGRVVELASKAKREHRNSFLLKEKTPPRHLSPLPSPNICSHVSDQTAACGRSSLSDPPSQPDENNSDLGTMSSGASVSRSRPKKWTGGVPLDMPASVGLGGGGGTAAGAEVSSITSDYSTTSSITFLTNAESSALSPELQGGEEADDERSELISEGRHMETDSESEFPVFAPGGGNSQSTPRPEQSREKAEGRGDGGAAKGGAISKQEARRLFPTHRMIECDTLSRRWSLRHKTDSDSSAEGAAGSGDRNEGKAESSSRFSRVLEVMKKGRSTSSISSSSRSESERAEPAWHLKITERLKLRVRSSADDMLAQKSRAPDARSKKKNIRRRHTMGGQRDFAELAVINDWREQGGVDQTADLSPLDHLKPRFSSQDFSIRDWIPKERRRSSQPSSEVAPKAVPEDDPPDAPDAAPENPPLPSSADAQPEEQVNGSKPQEKSKASFGMDPHPHKLSGGHVARSRFYQYL